MASMVFTFLGSFQVRRDGTPITHFRGDKVRALLAYLATESNRSHARASLAALLWPEQMDEQALKNLSQALVRLRTALGDEAATLIEITRHSVAWRPVVAEADVVVFQRLARSEQANDLAQAVALYGGEFLAGFALANCEAFEEWLLLTRQRLHERVLAVLHRLAEQQLAAGQLVQAAETAQRQVALNPLDEAAYRQLMRALAKQGDRAAALAAYERCQQILQAQLGVDPDAETQALYADIRAGDLLPLWRADKKLAYRLPAPLTPCIGREQELIQLAAHLASTAACLLTMVGPPGVGKTRLALELAVRHLTSFPGGIYFVDLASISDPSLVLSAIAQAVQIWDTGAVPLLDALIQRLSDTAVLLVLDNFEQVQQAAPFVSQLLAHCPQLKIVVTSRVVLRVRGEQEFPVEPLPVPILARHPSLPPSATDEVEALRQSPAIQLFCQRAAAVVPSFRLTSSNARAVAAICAQLDGLPLAIELAAAHIRSLPPKAMLARFANGRIGAPLRLLTVGAQDLPLRQQTLRSAIDWSYQLLNLDEQWILQQISVFVGGFSLQAAEAVCFPADPSHMDVLVYIQALIGKSLLRQRGIGDDSRFTMLESIREYALERLEARGSAAIEAVRQRHAHFYLELAEAAQSHFHGSEQIEWLDRIELEHDNLRASQEWFAQHGDVSTALRLPTLLRYFWRVRGYHSEGCERLLRILAHPEAAERTVVRARALNAAGYLQSIRGNLPEARELFAEALGISRECADTPSVAFALRYLGSIASAQHNYSEANTYCEESLALYRSIGSTNDISTSLMYLGDALVFQGNYAHAQALYQESVALMQALNNSIALPYPLRRLAFLALIQGDSQKATALCSESLALNTAIGDRQGIAACLVGLAAIAKASNQNLQAVRLLGAAEARLISIQTQLLPFDQQQYNLLVAALRLQLDAATFANAWAQGHSLPLEQLV